MSDETKEQIIIKELKRRCSEIKYGEAVVNFKIHNGEIVAGELVSQVIKLG
jgi:hypothetical protein